MMASNRDNRYPCPASVMRALLPFLRSEGSKLRYLMDQSFDQSLKANPGHAAIGSPAGMRALIVDDEETTRRFCRAVLESEGSWCQELGDGVHVLETVQASPFDAVLMDVQMPRMDGVKTLELLRANSPVPNLKIMMMSGKSIAEEMSKMLLAGADDFLTKPLSIVQLKA